MRLLAVFGAENRRLLPLWFKDTADFDRVSGSDRISVLGLERFEPGDDLTGVALHTDGTKHDFGLHCTLNQAQ